MFFIYPKFVEGQVDAFAYQASLIVMGVATFSFAFSSLYYYGASLDGRPLRVSEAEERRPPAGGGYGDVSGRPHRPNR